jgi:enoyl-CoA hydratase/carnithine racemase
MSASNNGHGSDTWHRSWTHLAIDRRSAAYCRVTFDHPPINSITPTTVAELAEVVGLIEQDDDLNVVVFASANRDVYLAGDGVEGDRGSPAWLDVLACLTRAPVVSIASIRGRAGGAGSEFVLSCDLRFASRENTALGAFDMGTGAMPRRLVRIGGRARALEVLLVADDLDGPRAEQYGYVNRLIADDRLDEEVEEIAGRLARVDHDAIARTKASVEEATRAPATDQGIHGRDRAPEPRG